MKLLISVFIVFSVAVFAYAEMENGMSNKCSQRVQLHNHKDKISNAFSQLNVRLKRLFSLNLLLVTRYLFENTMRTLQSLFLKDVYQFIAAALTVKVV